MHRLGHLSLALSAAAAAAQCVDTAAWDNRANRRCADYAAEKWCADGAVLKGKEWTSGVAFNHPERHCCACGKAGPPAPAAPAKVYEIPADLVASGALPDDVLAATHDRFAQCAAPKQAAADTLLYFARLPRSGSALMCGVLSACSGRQAKNACGGDGVAPTGWAGACPPTQSSFGFEGSYKLSPASYGCHAGLNGSGACSSFGGDVSAACAYMRTVKLPAATMMAHERFVELGAAPCHLPPPAIRLLALLRDPGERAQSAFAFGLESCVCNFKHPWCTQFSSFRFHNRQPRLCDGHVPRHGFAAALAVLRSHGQNPWPVTSAETVHVLGRYTAGVVKDAYTPYFGAYRSLSDTALGAPHRSSPALALETLKRCFSWVGIAEELALSLHLLKVEMPGFFGAIDTARFVWAPTSGATRPGGDPSAANQSQHPYLRSHVLKRDYEVYDAERRRLFQRAVRSGLPVVNRPDGA